MIRAARPYWAILRQQLIAGTQFRAGFWARLTTNVFWGYVGGAILLAFYRYGSGSAGLTAAQAVSMIWLRQSAMNLLPGIGGYGSIWGRIRTGGVGYDLLRPMDVYWHWYADAAASRLAPFLSSIVPIALVSLLTPGEAGLMLPASAAHLICFFASLAAALALSCAAMALSFALLLDARVGEAPANLAALIMQVLAGAYLPLQLWPDFMQGFLYWQPFAGMMDLPLRFYVGAASPAELARVLPLQLLWTAALVWGGRTWINASLKRLVMQGG